MTAVQRPEHAGLEGLDRGAARPPVEERHLAKALAGEDRSADLSIAREDLQPPGPDQVEAVAHLVRGHDGRAGLDGVLSQVRGDREEGGAW